MCCIEREDARAVPIYKQCVTTNGPILIQDGYYLAL